MDEQRGITIHFTDGSKKLLEFPRQLSPGDLAAADKLKAMLEQRNLMVEAEGALLVFPFENIRFVQIYPAPKKLPAGVIRGAKFKD